MRARNKRRLIAVLALTTLVLGVEVVGGLLTGSLALLADAGHMLTDVGALLTALFAIWFAERPATPQKTYGYYRAEILAALANVVVLIVIAIVILAEAYRRFWNPPEVLSGPMLAIAALGLTVNLIGLGLLRGGSRGSLLLRGAYLEVLSDAFGSLGVILAALIIQTTGWYRADPLISAVIALAIVPRTWGLLRESVNVLLEGTPPGVSVTAIEEAVRRVSGVRSVHDLHVWTITSGMVALSAHVTIADVHDGPQVLAEIRGLLKERYEIEHSTIQVEHEPSPHLTWTPSDPRG